MTTRPSDIRPLELATDAIITSRDAWLQIVFAGGIFVLLAQAILLATRVSGMPALVALGDTVGSFVMFLSTVAVSLVTSARVLGVQIPYLPSALINEKQFWQYVWAAVVSAFLAMLAVAACVGAGFLVMNIMAGSEPQQKLGSIPLYASGAVGAVLWAVVYAKLFLLLPAVVVGERVSPTAAWKRTKGVGLRIAASVLLGLGAFVLAEYAFKGAATIADPSSSVLLHALAVGAKLFRCAVEGALAGSIFAIVARSEQPAA